MPVIAANELQPDDIDNDRGSAVLALVEGDATITGIPMSAIAPIGTVTVGMPRWRIARLPLATHTPLRHAASADKPPGNG